MKKVISLMSLLCFSASVVGMNTDYQQFRLAITLQGAENRKVEIEIGWGATVGELLQATTTQTLDPEHTATGLYLGVNKWPLDTSRKLKSIDLRSALFTAEVRHSVSIKAAKK